MHDHINKHLLCIHQLCFTKHIIVALHTLNSHGSPRGGILKPTAQKGMFSSKNNHLKAHNSRYHPQIWFLGLTRDVLTCYL